MVSSNDTARVNHVTLMKQMKTALEAEGKTAELIIYPPYGSDGHKLFFEVGSYWNDVIAFFEKYL